MSKLFFLKKFLKKSLSFLIISLIIKCYFHRKRALRKAGEEREISRLDPKDLVQTKKTASKKTDARFPITLDHSIKLFPTHTKTPEVYGVDTAFLAYCWRWLIQDVNHPFSSSMRNKRLKVLDPRPEWACLVTGCRIDGIRMLSEIIPVDFSFQSFGGVEFDLDDFHRALRGMQHLGYSLHAVFHSHRFDGPVSPSNIDLNTQRNILDPLYPAIQAVFSEDGHIRFFSEKKPFRVRVFGKGFKHVEDTLIRLDKNLREAALAKNIWTSLVHTH